jgi:hypothetical protein
MLISLSLPICGQIPVHAELTEQSSSSNSKRRRRMKYPVRYSENI